MSKIEPNFTGEIFNITRQMVRSLIIYTVTTTDANCNLLKTLKEKKETPKYLNSILEKEGGSCIGSSWYGDNIHRLTPHTII